MARIEKVGPVRRLIAKRVVDSGNGMGLYQVSEDMDTREGE